MINPEGAAGELAGLPERCLVWSAAGTDGGSGCLVAPGTVLTCAHVVAGQDVEVVFGGARHRAKLDAESARADARQEAARAAPATRQATEADGKVRAVRAAARSTGRGNGPQDVAHRRDGGVDLSAFIDDLLGKG